jgi:proteasome lid subunit RPN8/RPN11
MYYITNRNKCFDQTIIDDAIKYSQSEWPNEACGIVVDNEFIPMKNCSPSPLDSFIINDKLFDELYIQNKIQCLIHSHEDEMGTPLASKVDQEQQLEFNIPFGIINMRKKNITHVIFWGDQLPIEPILQRHFFYGVWDCYGLCRDYIRTTMNITPPNRARDFLFWYKGIAFMENEMTDMPFIPIDLDKIQPNDFILYNIKGTTYVNHCGVYLGDGVLHHLYGQVSRKLPTSDFIQYARKAVRHNPEWTGYEE